MCNFWHKMEESLRFVQSLSKLQKNRVADIILPGIHAFLDDILSKESLSDNAESFRIKYVSLLTCSKEEALRRSVECREEEACAKHETYLNKISKLGQVEEKRLISIRQFQLNQSEDKPVLPNKRMELDPTPSYNTDDESRLLTSDDNFVELTKSDDELSTKEFSKLDGDSVNSGFLFHKENDGLRRRWCVLDEQVLKCYKRQNQQLVFDIDFRDGHYSAIQGRIGRMYAIRLSSAKAPRSHLFASPKAKVCASWMMRFRTVGVQLQADILREVSMNQQNNNKVTWALRGDEFSNKNEFASDLQEALELIERTKGPHILPKRSSYSFKELDVLRKLKASLVSKKSESKLNRRKTWSAGSLPISIVNLERFRNPLSVSDCNGLASKKDKGQSHGPNKSLPEILTSSGIVKIDKQDCFDLDTSAETVDPLSPSEDEPSFAMSMPEGLHKQHLAETNCSTSPRGSIVAQSVPDLLILPGQESPNQSFVKQEKHLKTTVSLSRVMSMKASLMKNAIMTGLRRKGRRSSGRVFLDRELADIQGCLYRKKGSQWKERWCIITKETFYAFRDSLHESEDFSCSLRKCIALRCTQEPGRDHTFKLVRRKGGEILLAAEDRQDLERWMEVLQREAAKQRFSEDLGGGSRSSSLTTTSLFSVETLGDSSAAEDTPTDVDQRESFYADTTDKDSSDEHSASGISIKPKPRGHTGKGYVYYLVAEDTWEHCWMEVSFGVLSIFTSQSKETVLQRDHIALCDIQENNTDSQRSHSFELKRPGRKPIYLEVDSEADFVKWLRCFKSWKKRDNNETTESKGDTRGYTEKDDNDVTTTNDTLLTIPPRSSTIGAETPATSDSDCCTEGTDMKKIELERPKIRRTMTSVLSQINPKGKRRDKSTAGTIDTSESHNTAVKSSFLYYKANSGLWVKQWCVLDSSIIFCFNSPEETKACFTVDVQGCDVRRTSCKFKNFTFDIFNRELDNHFEFSGESTYVMYAWMRVLKIAAGLGPKRTKSEGALLDVPDNERVTAEPKTSEDTVDGAVTAEEKDSGQEIVECQDDCNRLATSAPTSPKRKTKITSLDQVLKLLHEKQLEQQLQNKEQSKSERARLNWQHSMLVVLRKSRSLASLNSETNKPSTTVVSEPETVAPPELDEKTARVLHREISEKYDHILEDEKLKMLRRETLLKKRRNSLILQRDILEKKLVKCATSVKAPIKKRQSKADAKEMACFTKGDSKEVAKQLGDIKVELDGIQQDIDSNFAEQKKVSDELNEEKRKELHELRITVDMSQQQTKTTPQELRKFRSRQVSDSSLSSVERVSDDYRKISSREHTDKPKLTQSLSTPPGDLRVIKAKSFSSSRLPKAPSSPLLRTRTFDNGSGLGRPQVKSRASQEVLSLALSQIEDFEAFVQRSNGADIGC